MVMDICNSATAFDAILENYEMVSIRTQVCFVFCLGV